MIIPITEVSFSRLSSIDDVSGFLCCEKDLEEFLKEDAEKSQQEKLSATHLAYWQNNLVGFFTLVTDSIEVKGIQIGDGFAGYPYSRYPAIKIARLATDDRFTGQNIGKNMLIKIMAKSIVLTHHVRCRIITVDAKPDSYGFYEKHGFKRTMRKQNDTISMYRDLHRE